jgi:hypothetical protein
MSFDAVDLANFSQKRPGNLSLLRRELSDIDGHGKSTLARQRPRKLEPTTSTSLSTILGKRSHQQRNNELEKGGSGQVSAEMSTETVKLSKTND